MQATHCAECGSIFPEPPKGGGAAGYATKGDGTHICYECANAHERDEFSRADRYFAYLSGDGKSIQTWPGGTLARVTDETVRAVGFGFQPRRTYLRAIAPDGSRWFGTSPGRGMFCRLRRALA